jgi:beta-glucosidase
MKRCVSLQVYQRNNERRYIVPNQLLGLDWWHTSPIDRLGIPSVRLSDGPAGVRGTQFFNSAPALCIPCGTALGATFNTDVLRSVGGLLGREAKRKGAKILLGPTMNIQRSPVGGRGYESFSEDPYLSGILGGAYCQGIATEGVIATIKHFICNDQENQRMFANSMVTDRALREIYLKPFMLAIKTANPRALMTSYNKVNGIHVSESPALLNILRDDWKWDGLVMSDWLVLS